MTGWRATASHEADGGTRWRAHLDGGPSVTTMRAVIVDSPGGADALQIGEIERPDPGAGQVLVRVCATSINRADINQRHGNYPPPPGESDVLGLEVAGEVEELGPGVEGWKAGDRVMGLVGGGGYAEYALAWATHLMEIPEAMSFEEAACISETYITAYLNVFLIGALTDDEAVLLHGGGGGVNTAAIQLCKSLAPGARILVTASPGKMQRVTALGADLVIDYTTEEFAAAVRAFTDNRGADVILDHIGAEYLAANMKALAVGGRLVVIGLMGGAKAELNLGVMMVKRQRIIGSVLRARSVDEKASITAAFVEAVLPVLADRTIVPIIHEVYTLDEVHRAHETMESSAHFGKLVLRVA